MARVLTMSAPALMLNMRCVNKEAAGFGVDVIDVAPSARRLARGKRARAIFARMKTQREQEARRPCGRSEGGSGRPGRSRQAAAHNRGGGAAQVRYPAWRGRCRGDAHLCRRLSADRSLRLLALDADHDPRTFSQYGPPSVGSPEAHFSGIRRNAQPAETAKEYTSPTSRTPPGRPLMKHFLPRAADVAE